MKIPDYAKRNGWDAFSRDTDRCLWTWGLQTFRRRCFNQAFLESPFGPGQPNFLPHQEARWGLKMPVALRQAVKGPTFSLGTGLFGCRWQLFHEEATPWICSTIYECPLWEDCASNPRVAQPGSSLMGGWQLQVLWVQDERLTYPRVTLIGHSVLASCLVLFFMAWLSMLQVIRPSKSQIP